MQFETIAKQNYFCNLLLINMALTATADVARVPITIGEDTIWQRH
jgi:hypothetical protein